MKKRKVFLILCSISILSFGFIYLAVARPQSTSSATIANVEALTKTESSHNPCKQGSGLCWFGPPYFKTGVYISKD